MENENLRNIENLLAAKASTQPLYEFPVDQLPLGLRDSLSGVAAEARVPALFSALPIAATYADRLKAKYCDGSDTPMALMSIIIGEQASGKGVCRRIENIWAKKMDKDDEKPREDEAWYQQHKGKKGVVDPKPCIRHIGDTISKSALMRRQLCADGHTMYMFSEELGSMKSVWKVFGDYSRHGVHFPHDSPRKKSKLFRTISTIQLLSSMTRIVPQPRRPPDAETVSISSVISI